ncbi:MAG: TRAP transporter small permease subunit [Leptospirales bacterium]|nr:TRAP transporter small permease subunit [Leptospirales bacterium]
MKDSSLKRLRWLIAGIDAVNVNVGRAAAWLLLAMAVLVFLIAILRYLFNFGAVFLQEAAVYLHAGAFMVAIGYALLRGDHVRVDIFYHDRSVRHRALVDLLGGLLLLLPICLVALYYCAPYVLQSWLRLEQSQESGGIPALFLLKTFLLLGPALLLLQGIAQILRAWLRYVSGVEDSQSEMEGRQEGL